MKRLTYLSLTICVLALPFCTKSSTKTTTVVRDCTGIYLRMDGKDYRVCNTEKVDQLANGTVVSASFNKLKQCNGTARDAIVCMMYHENAGWIEVTKISTK